MKVVINKCYGGFNLSKEAEEFLAKRGNTKMYYAIDRNDPNLILAVETLGDKANGSYSMLKIVEIPDGADFVIDEYDGVETIHEKHNSWG